MGIRPSTSCDSCCSSSCLGSPLGSNNPQWGTIVGNIQLQTDLIALLNDLSAGDHTHTFASITLTPTTLAGYGITDAASLTHNHDDRYSLIAHTHDDRYSLLAHTHDEYLTQPEGDLLYASITHNHDAEYADTEHNHDDRYMLKALPVETVADAAYSFVLADAAKHKRFTNAGAVALTVPDHATVAFPTGTRIRGTAAGAGGTVLSGMPGVTLNSRGGALNSGGQFAVWEIEKVADNEWDCLGDLIA